MVACLRSTGRSPPGRGPQSAQETRFLRRTRFLLAVGCCAFATALLVLAVGVAAPEPAAIEAKRAELARVQAELDRIDSQVAAAAEAYNGARYRLSQVTQRIQENRRALRRTERDLDAARAVLAKRLRAIYSTPEPTLAEVLMTTGSITAVADQMELLDRIGRQDGRIVGSLRENKARLTTLRAQLVEDRATARREVDELQRQKEKVEGLLAERQRVLDGVKGELARMLAAEEARKRREAAIAAQIARQRQAAAAAAAAEAPSPQGSPAPSPQGSPAPSSQGSPEPAAAAAPLPSGSGNAGAASVAMQQLGVPYRWGGASPSGFDCSGLISYSYSKIGKSVPHFTGAIWSSFPRVPSGQLQVGDVVFFRADLGHAGIYIGGGQYVHAPQTGDVVKVSSMGGRSDYQGAVRP